MLSLGFRRFRPGGPYRPLHIALLGPPFIVPRLPHDLPVLEDEVRLLESQALDLLSVINEADYGD